MTKRGETGGSISADNTKLALYRKYRPTSLDQVVGQPQVTNVLSAAAKTGAFAHAYLFTGQRGTGKTTVARILAHLINGLEYNDNINSDNVDIIEIDAASNNGVDDVREIRDSVQLAPMSCSHKVYIIDEFHMLSKPAFNALLKTIEEPPEYVVFILATTELQKVPATILSRVQRFHFKPLPPELLAKHLQNIAKQEGIKADDDALLLIAKCGGGSVRDSITLLDQLSSNDHIAAQTVNDVLGMVSDEQIDQLIDATINGDFSTIVHMINDIISNGMSPTALAEQLIQSLTERANNRNQPALYTLVDRLLDVAKSALPNAKLLATLINYGCQGTIAAASPQNAGGQPKSPAHQTPASQLKQPDSAAKHDANNTATNATAPNHSNNDSVSDSSNTDTDVQSPAVTEPDQTQGDNQGGKIKELVWDDILQQLADQDRPSTRSLLEQCDYRYDPDSNTLTLFFGRAFHRKQAKGKGFNDALSATFNELYNVIPTIEISDESAPADSDVAAVLKLVGGEVTTITDGTV